MYVHQEWFIEIVFYIGDRSVIEWMQPVSMTNDKKTPHMYYGVCLV